MNTEEKIKVMQAWLAGKKIEYKARFRTSSMWRPVNSSDPVWDWGASEYRIVKEKITGWLNIYKDHGLGRNGYISEILYSNREAADNHKGNNRVSCVYVEFEVEENE